MRAGSSACYDQQNTELTAFKPKAKNEELIINTLIKSKSSGRVKTNNAIKSLHFDLKQLAKHTDLSNTVEVEKYIAIATCEKHPDVPLTNGTKKKLCSSYAALCKANGIKWEKPIYHADEIIPLIPATDKVNEIIAQCTRRYKAIFTIIDEIGCCPEELHKTHRKQIDTQKGEISITGVKGHASGVYRLKQATLELLIEYLAKNPEDYPFPKSKAISEEWRDMRLKASIITNDPSVLNIQLRNLRNHSGAIFYKGTGRKDPIATMRHLRHHKLETTMHYLRAIVINEPEEYITKAIQLGQPNTQKQIIEHSNAGYEKLTEADGYLYMRIHKT